MTPTHILAALPLLIAAAILALVLVVGLNRRAILRQPEDDPQDKSKS